MKHIFQESLALLYYCPSCLQIKENTTLSIIVCFEEKHNDIATNYAMDVSTTTCGCTVYGYKHKPQRYHSQRTCLLQTESPSGTRDSDIMPVIIAIRLNSALLLPMPFFPNIDMEDDDAQSFPCLATSPHCKTEKALDFILNP